MKSSFVITIGGEAGFGIMSAGLTLAKIATRSGFSSFGYAEYPSIVRGGYNVMHIAVGAEVRAPKKSVDFLIALNQESIKQNAAILEHDACVIFDADQKITTTTLAPSIEKIPVPFNRFAKEIGGSILMRNTVALGALVALAGGDLEILKELIDEEFATKKKDVAVRNKKCAEAGYNYVKKEFASLIRTDLKPFSKKTERLVMTGNDAIALGAIAAGMQFAAIYPMTPTSNILHILAPHQEEFGYIYKQPEDEISALTMAIGASFAGARSMVATAGGGFCLMTEGYGLAAMTETPVVIVVGMRGGPATGLPTWTEQGDLQFILHAHQGEFPRIVLAAGDLEEAFSLTMDSFNLAEKYQTPVIVLVDKHLCESFASTKPFAYGKYSIERGKTLLKYQENYPRYAFADDGISPRAFPGSGNHILANSDEHNERGFTDESSKNRIHMMDKRMKKLETCARVEMPEPIMYGPKNADLTIVSWGSNKGVILDAIQKYDNVNYLHITWMNPFPTAFVKKILAGSERIMIMECNYNGQLDQLIQEKTGVIIKEKWFKYDGRPFFVEEVIEKVNSLLAQPYGIAIPKQTRNKVA